MVMEDDGRPHNQSESGFLSRVVGPASWSQPPCTQFPSLQHLTLSSPSDQKTCCNHSQACIRGTPEGKDAQQIAHYPRVTSIDSVEKWKDAPPPSLPFIGKGTQPYTTTQIPLNSAYNQNNAMPLPFLPSHAHKMSQNGAWSSYKEHIPISSWVPGPKTYQNPLCSPEPAFGLRNVKTADGYVKSPASPTSPLHQPPEGITSHCIGLSVHLVYFD